MRKLRLLVALFVATGLFAAACGSSSSTDTATGDATAEATAADGADTEATAAETPASDATAADDDATAADDTADDGTAEDGTAADEEAIEEVAKEDAAKDDTGEDDSAMADSTDDTKDDTATGDAAGGGALDTPATDGPGVGTTIKMGRANWTTENVNAEIYRQLLMELGYDVTDPAKAEYAPALGYLAMAEGDIDFWINGWMPGHQSWLEPDMPDGTKVGDHLTVLGEQMLAGGLQGYLVTKTVAEENGITTVDQISGDPDLIALFDEDGDGKADLYGCPDDYTCDDIIEEEICQFDWNITQKIAGYDALFAEAKARVDDGKPALLYTWTPSAYVTQLIPGDNVMWISVENPVTDENCADQEGGEEYAQPGSIAEIPETQCLYNSKGKCDLGWTAADILAVANNDFLDANPAAAKLITDVKIPLFDASLANVDLDATDGSTPATAKIAAKWISDNRDTVDGWLDAARSAA